MTSEKLPALGIAVVDDALAAEPELNVDWPHLRPRAFAGSSGMGRGGQARGAFRVASRSRAEAVPPGRVPEPVVYS